MASQVKTQSTPAMSPSARQAVKVKGYVDHQIEKTRKQVKTVDLISGVLVLVALALGFILVAIIVDAWIWPLSTFARWLCLGTLLIGGAAYALLAIAPLLLKRINPDYAAKMIEDAKPSFQNSLLNYVSIRRRPEAVRAAVFDAVSRQAASDLSTVPSDATVDRSKLIRLGFVLIGLTVVAVGYKMLSPKDPLQSLGRILAPSAKIAKPSFVTISKVNPGDTKVFFGEHLTVQAEVRGRHRQDEVYLVYSTLDGQLVDQRILMTPTETPHQYEAELAMSGGGIQQSLNYLVLANDGASPEYQVDVRSNPSITIETVELVPPRYTKMQPMTLDGHGDVEAIEGTKVTIHAVANMPIAVATIELLNELSVDSVPGRVAPDRSYRLASTPISMSTEGKSAVGTLTLTMNSARSKPFATHYRIRFKSTDGERNEQPNVYPIHVIPDLAPEVAIKNPIVQNVEVAENGSLMIDVESYDLDFEIKSVVLHIDHRGIRIVDEPLVKNKIGNRVESQFQLSPSQYGLKAGDQLVFFATASDNRMSSFSEQPYPNVSGTDKYFVTISELDQQLEESKDGDDSGDPNGDVSEDSPDEKQGNAEGSKDGDEGSKDGDEGSKDGSEGSKDGDEGSKDGSEGSKDGDEGSKDGSEGSKDGDEGSKDGSEGSKDGSEGSKDGDEGSKDGSEGSKDGSEGSKDGSEGSKDGSEGSKDGSEGSKDGSKDGSEGSKDGSEGSKDGSEGSKDGSEGSKDGSEGSKDGSEGSKDGSQGSKDGSEGSNDGGAGNPGGDSSESSPGGEGSEAEDGSGQKDDSLTEGDSAPLSENASEGEKFQALKKHFDSEASDSKSGDSQERSDDKDSSQEDSPSGRDQDDPANENPTTGDQPGNEDERGDAGEPAEGGVPAEGDEPGGDTNPKGGQPKGNDGNPEGGAKTGDKSQGGDKPGGNGEKSEGGGDNPEGGGDNPEGGGDSPEGGSDKPEDGSGSPEGGGDKPEDGSGSPEGGGDKPEGGGDKPEGGGDKSEGGGDKSEGGGDKSEGGGDKSEGGGDKPEGGGDSPEGGSDKPEDGSGSPEGGSDKPEDGSGSPEGGGDKPEGGGDKPEGGGDKPEGGGAQPEAGSQPGGESSNSQKSSGNSDSSESGSSPGEGMGNSAPPSQEMEKQETNLDHAERAADLILNKLSEQQYDPDPQLLKKMNWTEEDLQAFIRHHEEMKRKAESGDIIAKRKYERSLKSLGFRPLSQKRSVANSRDSFNNLNQDSEVNRPPPGRARDFKSFLNDLNRNRDH